MARTIFDAEIGFAISAENGAGLTYLLSGTAVPDGTSGEQQNAPIGSLYLRSGTAELYQKIANAGAPADYLKVETGGVALDELNWRNEKVRFATGDTLAAGSVNVLTLSDNDDMVYGDIAVGEFVIGDVDGTPALFEVTATPGTPNITIAAASQPLADNDTFIVQQYLPDPTGQESQAIIHFPLASGAGVKIADVDWAIATGISLSGSYAASAGTVAGGDSVEAAIQKLDGNDAAQDLIINEIDQNVDDLITLSGVAENSTVLGAFASPGSFLLTASETIKSALQKLADYLFGVKVTQTTGVTTATACDSVPHATYKRVQWIVEVFQTATPANREGFVIDAMTDGTNVDDTKYSKLKLGASLSVTSAVVINGANLELNIGAGASSTVNVRRITTV